MALTNLDATIHPMAEGAKISLLSGFAVSSRAGPLEFPHVGSRLIAYLALQERPVSRMAVAGALWPETTQAKAQASLRSALWRVRQIDETLVRSAHDCLCLSEATTVDIGQLLDTLRDLEGFDGTDRSPLPSIPIPWFSYELLPDWYDDWVVFERERFRIAALHALDKMSAIFRRGGHYAEAAECALMAIRLEPLRESSQRALLETHLDQGNRSDALRQYRQYRRLLCEEMGVEPTPLFTGLLKNVGLQLD